jgi:hypothetical protein
MFGQYLISGAIDNGHSSAGSYADMRIRMRVSSKCLLALIALICVVVGRWAQNGREQRDIVAAIRALNGTVTYYFERTDQIDPKRKPEPPSPAWLRRVFGVDFFHAVMSVSLNGSDVTDESLPHLERLTHLESIELRNTAISELAAPKLRNPTIIGFFIDGGSIGDADLKWVGAMHQLEFVRLSQAPITTDICLVGTQVTKRGVSELHRCTGAGITWDGEYIAPARTR